MRTSFRNLQRIAVLTAALLPAFANAETPTLSNITAGDFDKIVEEFSANFNYTSVTPASSLGGLWGFEIGVVGGMTKAPELYRLVKNADPNTKFKDKLPHGGALLRVGLPLGLTAEAVIFPNTTISRLKMKQYGGAVQWTVTDVFFTDLPVTIAAKGYYTQTGLEYSQNVTERTTNTTVAATIDFEDSIYGAQAFVSKKFLVFEPYLGFGFAKANGELDVRANITSIAPQFAIFAAGFGNGRSASSNPSTSVLTAGLDVKLLFIALGAEFQRSFGKSSYTGRLSFRF